MLWLAMDLFHTLRRRRGSLGRALVAAFAATWLGLAVQPCMAHDAASEPTPSGDARHQGHDHHAGGDMPAGDMSQHCPHCPPGPTDGHDCATGTALECDAVGAPGLPTQHHDQLEPAKLLVGMAPVLIIAPLVALEGSQPASPVDSPHPPGATLQQRFCTYLK